MNGIFILGKENEKRERTDKCNERVCFVAS